MPEQRKRFEYQDHIKLAVILLFFINYLVYTFINKDQGTTNSKFL